MQIFVYQLVRNIQNREKRGILLEEVKDGLGLKAAFLRILLLRLTSGYKG
ncbi:hypothetical protein C8R30_15210 [Nitrosomonas nitrosa]|nr:hypothetical protein C8R30_15210 [Nitrosomonas nitrosa]